MKKLQLGKVIRKGMDESKVVREFNDKETVTERLS